MFAHLQVHMQGDIHYSPAHKGALYKEVTHLWHFSNSAVTVLQTLVIALGAGLGIWGAINLLEGYGNDNPGALSTYYRPLLSHWAQA